MYTNVGRKRTEGKKFPSALDLKIKNLYCSKKCYIDIKEIQKKKKDIWMTSLCVSIRRFPLSTRIATRPLNQSAEQKIEQT